MVNGVNAKEIERKVLKEWFGTDNLDWLKDCPNDEIGKDDLLGCIRLAIKLTAKEILKYLEKEV